jgi:type II secretory pathway pseudopilin PulG
MEMVVVLGIIVAVSGSVLITINSSSSDAEATVTRVNMIEIRNAMIQYWQDVKDTDQARHFLIPATFDGDALHELFNLRVLLENPDLNRDAIPYDFPLYDPATRIGWRGPYVDIQPQRYLYTATNSTSDNLIDDTQVFFTANYGQINDVYGREDDLSIRDSYTENYRLRRPFIVQVIPIFASTRILSIDVRIVSAGPDAAINIPRHLTNAQLLEPTNAQEIGDDVYVAFQLRP